MNHKNMLEHQIPLNIMCWVERVTVTEGHMLHNCIYLEMSGAGLRDKKEIGCCLGLECGWGTRDGWPSGDLFEGDKCPKIRAAMTAN